MAVFQTMVLMPKIYLDQVFINMGVDSGTWIELIFI